ncbi:Protein of unknown function [Bacillus cytotoxicus]|uniref:Uncharacterized protein n=1 Tax=Bacillus cytotoxicus TaxID=580165 RepID=A0AAX2CFY7_9BACI|nr:Protein of unknown function [Bacillus cytotoxicus]
MLPCKNFTPPCSSALFSITLFTRFFSFSDIKLKVPTAEANAPPNNKSLTSHTSELASSATTALARPSPNSVNSVGHPALR